MSSSSVISDGGRARGAAGLVEGLNERQEHVWVLGEGKLPIVPWVWGKILGTQTVEVVKLVV